MKLCQLLDEYGNPTDDAPYPMPDDAFPSAALFEAVRLGYEVKNGYQAGLVKEETERECEACLETTP